MPSLHHLSTQKEMQLQSESTYPTLQMQMQTMALARARALAKALAQAKATAQEEATAQGEVIAQAEQAEQNVQDVQDAQTNALIALIIAQNTQIKQAVRIAQAAQIARVAQIVEAEAEVERQARALVLAHSKAEAHVVTYGEVLADSKLKDIIYSIEPKHRRGLARDLWRHSECWWLIQVIVPITRLPQELLHQILLIIIDNASHSPFVLMRVSKLWHSIVTGIWASLKLGSTTPRHAVTRKSERNQWLLSVVIDTEFDRGDFTPSEDAYQAILAAIQGASRWRSLLVETFAAQTDLPEDLMNSGLQQCSDVVMGRLKSFKIKSPGGASSLLGSLLCILDTIGRGELTTVEINSPSVISILATVYPSSFHSVKVLCLDTPQLPNPVDLLPHLPQLEAFTASHLHLPIYPNDVNLPFVDTLRRLTLRAVPIQWMSGRTFHVLESCTLLFPIHRYVQHTFSTTLPNCNDLSFQGYPLDILDGISAKNLTHLTVKCSCSEKTRGSSQLVRFTRQALQESRLAPQTLHISVEATTQAWAKAFACFSDLEELVIHNAQPSSLEVKVLQSLVVHPVHGNHLGTSVTRGTQYTPLCPSLKRFGLRYRRWSRPSEQIDVIPEFVSIIRSRQRSKFSLQSFRIWMRDDQKDPLELIEGSQISFEVFERLANEGEIKDENLLHLVLSGLWRIWV